MRRGRSSNCLGDVAGETSHKSQFHDATNCALQQGVARRMGQKGIRRLNVAVDEYSLPRHQHVVKYRQGVLFVKPGRDWSIKYAPSIVIRFTADKFQSRGIHRNGKAERVRFFTGFAGIEGSNPDLIRKWSQRG